MFISARGMGAYEYTGEIWGPGDGQVATVPGSGSHAGAGTAIGYGTAAGLTWMDPNKTDREKLILTAPQIVGATLGTASALGAGWATAAIPIVGPIIAGATIGLSMLFARKGPKQKVATTAIVDQVEPFLRDNRDGYLANPTPEGQRQALENFNAGWQYVVEHCNIPEMGTPGRNCVTERDRGGRWDWFALYADPILSTPPRAAATAASGNSGGVLDSLFGSGASAGSGGASPANAGSGFPDWIIPAAAVLAAVYFMLPGGSR